MSYSLVALLRVIAFLSAITADPPLPTQAPLLFGARYDAIKEHIIEKSVLNTECTAPRGKQLTDLARTIKAEYSLVMTSTSVADIESSIVDAYLKEFNLDETQSNKIYAIVAKQLLYPSNCASVLPTVGTDLLLRKSLVDEARIMIGENFWRSVNVLVACTINTIMQALKEISGSFPSPGNPVEEEINAVVNAMNIDAESSGIETGKINPSYDLISASYESGKTNPQILSYIGSPPNEDAAKRSVATCFYNMLLTRRLNTQLQPPLRKKLKDHLFVTWVFGQDCSVPNTDALKKLTDELITPGKLLENSDSRTVRITLHDIFVEAKLTESEEQSAIVVVSGLAMPPPTCSAKSPLLADNNDPLLATALVQLEALLVSNVWDQKKLGYKCLVQKLLNEVKASFDVAVESIPNDIKEDVKAAVNERNSPLVTRSAGDLSALATAATVNKIEHLAEVTKAFNAAKEKTKTKEWMGSDAGMRASILCMIDTLVTEESSKPKGDEEDKENNVDNTDNNDTENSSDNNDTENNLDNNDKENKLDNNDKDDIEDKKNYVDNTNKKDNENNSDNNDKDDKEDKDDTDVPGLSITMKVIIALILISVLIVVVALCYILIQKRYS